MGLVPRRQFNVKTRSRRRREKIKLKENRLKSLSEIFQLVHHTFSDTLPVGQMSAEPSQRKSIDRSCKKGIERRPVQVEGTSPVLRGRKRKNSAENTEQPLAKKMAEGQILEAIKSIKTGMEAVQNQIKSCATSRDLDKLVTEIRDVKTGVQINNDRIEKLYELRKQDQAALTDQIERIVDKKVAAQGTRNSKAEDEKETQYQKCRRSIRMWPVPLSEDLDSQVRKFMRTYLSMPEQMVSNTRIDGIEPQQQPRRSKISDEVLVRFCNVQTRDIVQSYAISLAQFTGKAGLRLEIPDHLRSLFRRFESHVASLREQHGNVKRAIRFDDETRSLRMDVKLENTQWHRLTQDDMTEIATRRKKDRSDKRNGQSCNMERQRILMVPEKEPGEYFHECEDE